MHSPPASRSATFEKSTGSESTDEVISTASGILPASGMLANLVPYIESLWQI